MPRDACNRQWLCLGQLPTANRGFCHPPNECCWYSRNCCPVFSVLPQRDSWNGRPNDIVASKDQFLDDNFISCPFKSSIIDCKFHSAAIQTTNAKQKSRYVPLTYPSTVLTSSRGLGGPNTEAKRCCTCRLGCPVVNVVCNPVHKDRK